MLTSCTASSSGSNSCSHSQDAGVRCSTGTLIELYVADTGRKQTLFHSKWLNSSSYISRMLY